MNLGEIFVWTTDQAKGHASRRKYHVYLSEAGWRGNGHAFLFINKSDYGGDYRIFKTDYPFLDLEFSFVSCGDIVTYTDERLAAFSPIRVGNMHAKHMKELYSSVMNSEIMVQWQIDIACGALKVFL